MRAARFHEPGEALRIEEVADPVLEPGAAIVRVLAAFVPPYFAEMIDGTVSYPLPPLPFTPGMDTIGEIVAVADDVSGLEVDQRVFCDHFYNTVNIGGAADSCYVGVFGKGEQSARILARWRDGSFAEKMILPAECFTPLGEASAIDPALLVRLGWLGTCYGAFLRSDFRPGHTVVVNAATGLVGAAGVLLALAMGAGKVVAVGRKERALAELEGVDPKRVTAVRITGGEGDAEAIAQAAGGADIMLDAVGDMAVNYKWMLDKQITIIGSSWYPRRGTAEMLGMIGRGALDANVLRARKFALDEAQAAVEWAAHGPGGLEHAAIVP